MSRRRLGWVVAGLAAFAALGSWAGSSRSVAGDDWVPVRREDLVLGVPVTGTLAAVESASLGPPPVPDVWDFKISFMAPEGAVVRAGQPVLGFDTSELERILLEKSSERDSAAKELEKRQADLAAAQRDEELRLAEAQAARRRAALKVDVPAELQSAQDLAEARQDLALAEKEIAYLEERIRLRRREAEAELRALAAKRDSAAARVAVVQSSIERMTITAPRDGTVIYPTSMRGEKKKVGDSCWRTEIPIELPDLTRMRGKGEIEEADAGRITAGMPLSLRLDAHPDVLFPARVESLGLTVRPRSRTEPQKVVDLEISIQRTDPQRMRPGMRFAGTVETARVPRALVVPVEAVFLASEGPAVHRRDGLKRKLVPVRLGRRNDRLAEVLSGLAEGDQVARRETPAGAAARPAAGTAEAPAAGGAGR